MKPPPPKKQKNRLFEYSRSLARAVAHAVTYLSSDGAELSDRLFGQNKPFYFFNIFNICVCVFCGECGFICMISICVADNQLLLIWLNEGYEWLYGPYLYDYHLYYRTSVCDYWHINSTLTIRAYTTYKAIFIFIFITQIVLVCFSGKINNLYDV